MFYSHALTLDPYDEESLIGRGSCYTVKKNHKGAVANFKKALDIPPESRNAPLQHVLYAIAENYRQQKDFPIKAVQGTEARLAFVKTEGLNFSEEDLKQVSDGLSDELTDKQLDAVSGG